MRIGVNQRGDTIIEVMVAFAVFAMVAVGAFTIMNQGTAGAQNTLETTLVRQQVDNQAEYIRYLHQAYISNPNDLTPGSASVKFKDILAFAETAHDNGLTQPSSFGATCTQTIPGTDTSRFVLNKSGDRISNVRPASSIGAAVAPYAQLADSTTSYGLWIEPIVSEPDASGTTRYIDFHVRACWESASASSQSTLGTIVRLYVPDNVATGSVGSGGSPIPAPTMITDFSYDGASRNGCYPHKDVERDEQSESRPTWTPPLATLPGMDGVDVSAPAVWQCQVEGAAVYSCVNYDVQYQPNIPAASTGNYELTLRYYDANCGAYNYVVPPYVFKVDIYKDDAYLRTVDLSPSATPGGLRTSTAINIGAVSPTTRIQIRWWNNHFYGPTMQDPDFAIQQLILQRTGP